MAGDFVHRFEAGVGSGRVLLLLHGTGGTEEDLLGIGRSLDADAALLSPRGRVLENGMPRWFRRLAEGVFDEEDLLRRAGELADFVGWTRVEYGLGDRPIVAVGYSNGANVASALMFLRPGVLAGGILLRGMVPFACQEKPDLTGTRVLLLEGESDSLVPRAEGERLTAMLRDAGAQAEIHWTAGGHELHSEDFEVAGLWLKSDGKG